MHFIAKPFSIIISSIRPSVLADALDVIIAELADVACPVMPVELTMSVLSSVDVSTFVACLIRPSLDTVAVLLVVLPAALIHGTVVMHVLALAISLVVEPLALINVTIRVDQSTDTVGLACLPLPFVQRAIKPDLASFSSSRRKVCLPLTNVDRSAGKLVGLFLN